MEDGVIKGIDWWSTQAKMTDPECINKVWTKPNRKDASRKYPAPIPNVIELPSVIIWFDMFQDTLKFTLPDNVQKKLHEYSFCLFGPVDYEVVYE